MPVTAQLVTPSQMESLRNLAKTGMQTTVTIERRSEGTIPVGGDYGDDFLEFSETSESQRTVKGWFYSQPAPMQNVDTGMIVTVTTYRLFLPVGTDILTGDIVRVGSDEYVVSDTTAEGTWLPLLTCSLRKRE